MTSNDQWFNANLLEGGEEFDDYTAAAPPGGFGRIYDEVERDAL